MIFSNLGLLLSTPLGWAAIFGLLFAMAPLGMLWMDD